MTGQEICDRLETPGRRGPLGNHLLGGGAESHESHRDSHWTESTAVPGRRPPFGSVHRRAPEHVFIAVGQGVCGTAVARSATSTYRTCPRSRTTRLLDRHQVGARDFLIRKGEKIFAQIDVDSHECNAFDLEAVERSSASPIGSRREYARRRSPAGGPRSSRGPTRPLDATSWRTRLSRPRPSPSVAAAAARRERTLVRILEAKCGSSIASGKKLSAIVGHTDAGLSRHGRRAPGGLGNAQTARHVEPAPTPGGVIGSRCNRVLCRRDALCAVVRRKRVQARKPSRTTSELEHRRTMRHIYVTAMPILSPVGRVTGHGMVQDVSRSGSVAPLGAALAGERGAAAAPGRANAGVMWSTDASFDSPVRGLRRWRIWG